MTTITLELTFDQLLKAIRRLPREDRIKLAQTVLQDDIEEINRRFDEALRAIEEANPGVTEDEVMADAVAAVHEYRAERAAQNRR
jgi:hypothetical protein